MPPIAGAPRRWHVLIANSEYERIELRRHRHLARSGSTISGRLRNRLMKLKM